MKTRQMMVAVGALTLAATGVGPVSEAAPATGAVHIVQAVPGTDVDVSVDGRSQEEALGVGKIVGPLQLSAGAHRVRFADTSGRRVVSTLVRVAAGSNSDIVLHRPASVSGKDVVNVYRTPMAAIGPGKSRVLVAHTATAAPADVRVDGRTVFTNIANGEFAQADVPAGKHVVTLLPTGQKTSPILGPLNVVLPARTITMVYAVGTPTNGSMRVIAHSARIGSDGTVTPDSIDTGSAGLAADQVIRPFAAPTDQVGQLDRPGGAQPWGWGLLVVALLTVALGVARSRRGGGWGR